MDRSIKRPGLIVHPTQERANLQFDELSSMNFEA